MVKPKSAGIKIFAILLILALGITAFGCLPQQPAATPTPPPAPAPAPAPADMKVGFVYVGSIGDAGWTFAHDQARKYVESKLPWVETMYVERVPPGADFERVVREMIQQGATVIFGTSFGYMDFMVNLAAQFPNVKFMHATGFKTAPNMSAYFGRVEDARFLSGMVAGLKTKTNRLGYVAAHPIPEVILGLNAFTLGARLVNPQATVQVVWTNTWFDPAREREAAITLLDAGADVIGQHQDSPAAQQAAQERGAFGTGNNSDMRHMAPKATLTGPVWNWGPFYVEILQSIRDGKWESTRHRWAMPDIVDLGPFNDALVPKDVQERVLAKRQQIIDGTFFPFTGPIKDQTGAVRVPAGVRMTEAELLGMNWLIEGVVGSLPAR
jgi:basic membrane protein A